MTKETPSNKGSKPGKSVSSIIDGKGSSKTVKPEYWHKTLDGNRNQRQASKTKFCNPEGVDLENWGSGELWCIYDEIRWKSHQLKIINLKYSRKQATEAA